MTKQYRTVTSKILERRGARAAGRGRLRVRVSLSGGPGTMDCFEAPRMGLNLIFIKVSAAPTGALGPWKVEEP